MARACSLHPTVYGRKGAAYLLHEGRLRRLTRAQLLRGQLPDGTSIPPAALVVVGVEGHVRAGDVARYDTELTVLTAEQARAGVGRSVPPPSDPRAAVERVGAIVGANAAGVAQLGRWPGHITADSLTARIPNQARPSSSGFDAGVAVALGMIPEGRAELAARLHAAYTPDAVAKVREEMGLDGRAGAVDGDSESVWWLAACSVCREGGVDAVGLVEQLDLFRKLRDDPDLRLEAASAMLEDMLSTFEVRDGVAWATRDGGMQGAYLAGHEVAVQYSSAHDLHFVGTYRTDGFDFSGFVWAEPDDAAPAGQQGRSGPVFGSHQFVKARDTEELVAALGHLRDTGQM